MRKISILFLYLVAIFTTTESFAQATTQGPTMVPQLNTDFYVGSVSGFYQSIQNAVTLRCAAAGLGSRVIIPAGSPADGASGYTISAVTGGCVKVAIEDRRSIPVGNYKWISTAYVLQNSGGGTPPVIGGSSQYANQAANAFVSGGQFNEEAFISGAGNNGVTNAQALGIKNILIPHDTTSTEDFYSHVTLNGTHTRDERLGFVADMFFNPNPTANQSRAKYTYCVDNRAPTDPTVEDHMICDYRLGLSSESGMDVTGIPTYYATDSVEDHFFGNGIHQSRVTVTKAYTDDDMGVDYAYLHVRAAELAGASEGSVLSSKQGWEDGAASGTVTDTGAAGRMAIQTSLTNGGLGNSAHMIFTSENIARGTITAYTPGVGQLLGSIATTDTHAISSGYGFITAQCGTDTVANSPLPAACSFTTGTFNGTTGFGSFAPGLVAVGDWHDFECVNATAVSSTITLNLTRVHPAGTPIYQGTGTCGGLLEGRGFTPMWAQTDGFIPNYQVAGARTATSWDVMFQAKNAQNGQNPIPVYGPITASVATATQVGTTVTLGITGSTSNAAFLNHYTAPTGSSICVSGNSNAAFNICGITNITATNSGFTLTYTVATSASISGTGGIINIGTVTNPTINARGNYEIDCSALVKKIKGQDVNHWDGNGSVDLEANNCTMAAGETFIQPNNPAQNFEGQRIGWNASTPSPGFGSNTINEWITGGMAWSGGDFIKLGSVDGGVGKFMGYGGDFSPKVFVDSSNEQGIGTWFNLTNAPISSPFSNHPEIGGSLFHIGPLPDGGVATSWDLFNFKNGGFTLRVDEVNNGLTLLGQGISPFLSVSGALSANSISAPSMTGAELTTTNFVSNAKPGLTIGDQFNNTSCRGALFGTIDNYPSLAVTPTARICSGHDFSNNWYMNIYTGWNDQKNLTLWLDSSNVEHAKFEGDIAAAGVSVPTASVLAATTTNDLASFDNATGHLADSGILKGALVLLNAANQFGNSTQSFGLTGSGQTQISNTGQVGISPSLATVYTLNNTTGVATFTKLATLANCSSAASPAVCGAAAAGSVVIATSATSVTVNTTAVTANSQILITPDASLGTKLGVTCNSTTSVALAGFGVTARVAGTSFTLSTLGTVTTNPACYSYSIIN